MWYATSILLAAVAFLGGEALPTVYEYYTENGIQSGLEALKGGFKLNGKDITIQSGAIHYFRVHPQQWRDRLRKLRASGLIAVETYVPWNLHEPEKGVFDFGQGGRDFSAFLDLQTYLRIAQEEDLLVLFRPGPYICAEWEMGGLPSYVGLKLSELPTDCDLGKLEVYDATVLIRLICSTLTNCCFSWLLNIPNIKMRTSEAQYSERVAIFYNKLLPLVKDLQFRNGGPIIAVQLENEYSSVDVPEGPDQQYLYNLKKLMESNGINEFLYTSDNTLLEKGSIPEVLRTINFQGNVENNLKILAAIQPDKPVMVMEFWTGWFDHWMYPSARLGFDPNAYRTSLETIMKFPASFNLYMFNGGTSFGFLNGANSDDGIIFDVTSYDYFAPLSESGDYTEKYSITQTLVGQYQPVKFENPDRPASANKTAYGSLDIQDYLTLNDILAATGTSLNLPSLTNMEQLDINNGNGQSFGYVSYRKTGIQTKKGDILKISGKVHDVAQVFVDGKLQTKVLESTDDINGFGYWKAKDAELILPDSGSALDILVENLGRINFGRQVYTDRKGLFDGPVSLNGANISDWKAVPLEFKGDWVRSLASKNWQKFNVEKGAVVPGLYRAFLNVPEEPTDTFVDTQGWTKGVIFINGFNLGRFNKLGPQQRLYLPAPLLNKGQNTILIFEQFIPNSSISFSDKPNLG